jgi:transposase
MTFVRKIKVGKRIYLAEVKNVREEGKVKQKFIRYIGKEVAGETVRRIETGNVHAVGVKSSVDVMAIRRLAEELSILEIEQKEALSLVFSQLMERKSISKLEEWFQKTEIPEVIGRELTTKNLYTSLRELADIDFDRTEEKIYQKCLMLEGGKTAAVIDVTDTYFEGKGIEKHNKRRKGKDEKVRHLIQIGLAVTLKNGFPIFHKIYPGNLNDMQIMRDMVTRLKEMDIKAILVDRGMLAGDCLRALFSLSAQVIAGLRKSPNIVKKYLSQVNREEIYSLKNRVTLVNTSVFIKSFKTHSGTIIIVYNPDLEVVKRNCNFEKGIECSDPYIGYSVIFHNTSLEADIVVRKYFEKDIVERAFKQLKGVLKLRPIRAWLKEHVKGHVRICYLAYAILALLQYKIRRLDISAPRALELLKDGYKIRLEDKKSRYTWDLTVDLQPQQRKILDAIGVVTKN